MKIKKWYMGIIGIILLAYILSSIDIRQLFQTLLQINLAIFAIAVLLEIVSIIIKGIKYVFVVKAHNESISLSNSIKYTRIGFFLSMVTPGKIGELARAFYINKKIHSLGKSLSTVVVDRAIDLVILLSTGFAAAVFLSLTIETNILPIEAIAIVIVLFILLAVLASRKNLAKKLLKPIFKAIIPEKMKHKTRIGFNDFYAAVGKAVKNKKELTIAVFCGIMIWIVTVFALWFYLLSLNIFTVPFYFIIILLPAIITIELLPISFSGIGTRDAVCILLLGIFGVTAPEAVAFSVLLFATGYLLNAAIGFVFFSNEPIKRLKDLQ